MRQVRRQEAPTSNRLSFHTRLIVSEAVDFGSWSGGRQREGQNLEVSARARDTVNLGGVSLTGIIASRRSIVGDGSMLGSLACSAPQCDSAQRALAHPPAIRCCVADARSQL